VMEETFYRSGWA